VYGGIGDC